MLESGVAVCSFVGKCIFFGVIAFSEYRKLIWTCENRFSLPFPLFWVKEKIKKGLFYLNLFKKSF